MCSARISLRYYWLEWLQPCITILRFGKDLWDLHVARLRAINYTQKNMLHISGGKHLFGNISVYERIILKWALEILCEGVVMCRGGALLKDEVWIE